MDTARWKQIDELFDAVLDLPENERERFLAEKTDGDEDLKNEVLSLLKARTNADKFLEASAMKIAARNLAEEGTVVFSAYFLDKTIGTFKIERLLGAGGMGEVYLAQDEKLKRKVALKILPAEYISSDDRVKRFQLEARAISALNHPNIVTIYDVGTFNGINYIATEYVEGKTVRELIGSNLKVEDILSIIIQSCEALSAAHNAGIIHRDIKPENIMVRPDGYVKILDFGLAKLSDISPQTLSNFTKTAKGVIIGTPAYMSPEQIADEKVDHRTDLWSIGVVLYELLTGINPYKKENRQATFQAILSAEPSPASSLNAEISPELDQILIKALEKDADLSYQTASDLRADLKRVKREVDSSPSLRSSSSKQRREETKVQRRFLLFTFYFLLFTFIGFGVWFFVFRQNRAAVDWSKASNVQLTDQAGTEFFPSLAPDGKSFVFAAKSGENYDVFLQRIGDKKARNLTEDSTAHDSQPAISPDGERIAFRSEREAGGIYVMGATGENVRRIADFGFHPSWSPDGKEIVVSTFGHDLPDLRNPVPSELWILTIESGAKRLLTQTDAMQPAWSPDGKFIAFWFYAPSAGRRDIAVISAGGGEPTIITKDGTTNWNPVWSPDGKFLYFASDSGGNMNFWRVGIDESGKVLSEPEAVVTPSKYSRHLGFSRDGKHLIYVSTDIKSNIQAVNFDPKIEKTTGEPFWVTSGDRQVSRPELSPDGNRFVYRLPRRTQDDIVVVNRDGANQRDVTDDAAFDRYPRWSPDGKQIAFTSDRTGVYEIFTVDADGTNLRQITFNNRVGTSFPLWSPDGRRILFRSNPKNFIVDSTKNWNEQTPLELPTYENPDSNFVAWDWSPDGSRLAGTFRGNPMRVGYFSFPEKRFEPLADTDHFPMWLPDNRRLIYAFAGKILILDTETKKTSEILSLADEIGSIGISRDGKLIYYVVSSSESDIWLLDNSQN